MMDQGHGSVEPGAVPSAFRFTGRWGEYAPIAFTNLLLVIVTLGFYRFWATTRTRHYLWSRTHFIDESLEWTGTGRELLVGFGLAVLLFGVPFFGLQFVAQALALRGHVAIAGLMGTGGFLLVMFLTGVARFRTVRYRLSRTYWHGIRGGSDDNGLAYGFSWVWKTIVGVFPAWLLVPWSMTSLWNDRWERMSFGSQTFRSEAQPGPIYKRFLLFYLAPVLLVIAGFAAGALFASGLLRMEHLAPGAVVGLILFGLAAAIGLYLLLGIIGLAYYAAFLREAIGHVSLGGIDFHFSARTRQWLALFIVDVLLVVGTLGIGALFLTYRHWKFFITHLEATGEVSLSALGQSMTRDPGQGEGLFDAFDVGAL